MGNNGSFEAVAIDRRGMQPAQTLKIVQGPLPPQAGRDMNAAGGEEDDVGMDGAEVPEISKLLSGAKSLIAHANAKIDDSQTILGDRLLCIGGGLFWVAPSGQGKSSSINQSSMQWSCGRDAFGIKPAKSLRIVILQSENDDGDVTESVRDLPTDLDLTEAEIRRADENTLVLERSNPLFLGANAHQLVDRIELVMKEFRADLLIIDNYASYIAGTIPDDMAQAFLANELTPMLVRCRAAVVIVGHTPKTQYRNTAEWKESDWQYAMQGRAGLTNWARAAIVIDPINYPVFAFRAAKRGSKVGWTNEYGDKQRIRYYKHHPEKILWVEAAEDEVEEAKENQTERQAKSRKKPVPTKAEVLAHVLPGTERLKIDVINELQPKASQQGARDAVASAIFDGELYEWEKPNPKGGAYIVVSREPKPELI